MRGRLKLRSVQEWLSRNSNSLQAERSGDRISVWVRFFEPVHTGPGAYPASCTMCTGCFPGVKRPKRGVDHAPPLRAEVDLLAPEFYI
jgi:hypothetical protein